MEDNSTKLQNHPYPIITPIESTIFFLICLSGLVGNGIVIYLLGFRIKRNVFTIYILNLSIADFGYLTGQAMWNIFLILHLLGEISFMNYLFLLHGFFLFFTFLTKQFLLLVISIDRSVRFFFPLLYQLHHPARQSTATCAVIWIFTFLISVTDIILLGTIEYSGILRLQYYLNTVIFMPIMCVSTIAMLIKICLRSQRKKCGKLLRAILLVLVFFFFFVYPINIINFINIFQNIDYYLLLYTNISASLNCTINPMIYYLVGRDKMGRSSKRIDKVLEELFKEDEVYKEKQEITEEHQL